MLHILEHQQALRLREDQQFPSRCAPRKQEPGRIVLVEERIAAVDASFHQRDHLAVHHHLIREYLGSGEIGRIVVEVVEHTAEGVAEHIAGLRMD